MFGSNNVQSTWGQQPQQPQQTNSAFGQPSAFGSGGAFGQNQQQQPAANPMFGNLGTPSTTAGTSGGFGAFANTNNPSNTSSTLFGGSKPSTGFGAFGGGGSNTATFGSGGAFGSTANNATPGPSSGTGLFGNTNQTNSTFGSGSGLFGSKPATTTFGTTQTNSSGAFDSVAPVTTGTASTPFSPFGEKDSANSSITLQYQSITAMPSYRGSSFEVR
ncbi:hypothetical protein PILCRDRAFT_689754 [Piloderma croceum F 1598]|uniref:Uncharacterized protein n=1 Tax=Piloderma croceum (strain F 1598) TaxID=765440 RepID=A0A0C3F535_PILCF|nr:hypothetical protein PILCRDRAFT_689754 [Piloderma croceum F 1598]